MGSLEELARLDLDSLPEFISNELPALRGAVALLELQLWLREEGVKGEEEGEKVLYQLMEAGHTSKQSLLALDPTSAEKVGRE